MSTSLSSNHTTRTVELRIRPYLLTGGRTRGSVELALETPLRATPEGEAALPELVLESEQIVRYCQEPTSVTELAARLGLPLQVTRVLTADLIDDGFVQAHISDQFSTDRPDLNLLERVLDGLQGL